MTVDTVTGAIMKGDERQAALRANMEAYGRFDERAYINGAPHLKHQSIGRLYSSLVDAAIESIGREPHAITVLELGAGNGLASKRWFERSVRLTAVDSSASMLRDLAAKAAADHVKVKTVVGDALDYLAIEKGRFDIVTHVSMLHHVPDYLELLAQSLNHVQEKGCLLTFQDPERYDHMALGHHALDRASYFVWRAGQGNLKRGLKTRWRRLRGVYSPDETVDFDEYHVVRNGVDSAAISSLLEPAFTKVEVVAYWSTYSRGLQWLGERAGLTSSFGILASGRKPS
jgi:2-polyprenyl-3-methyl-5-hydroxy-6-metoxy-1,4-benzoquinol methylase